MDEYTFEDALASSTVTCSYPGLTATRVSHGEAADAQCTSLFFPGCSFINYGLPLVQAVYDLLAGAGQVDGLSLLCCGKILEYEQDEQAARRAFEQQLRDHLAGSSIKRIVAACPNCVKALRNLLKVSAETAGIEVVPLPKLLVDMGYTIDPDVARSMAQADPRVGDADVVFCPKDSCPDRATGEFADALRAILPADMQVEPQYARKRSYCCGSRPRAAGHYDLAAKMSARHGAQAREVGANALATACMSCTYLLSTLQTEMPVFHYLELLYNWRIPWEYTDQYMKLRFLFDDALGVREFKGLESGEVVEDATDGVEA